MSSLADMLGAAPKIDTAIDTKKAMESVVDAAIKKETLSDTKAIPVTANPIDNDSLVKLTTGMADMKALLEGMDKRMKEGFAALLLKVTGGKPVDAGEIQPPDYADVLPTRANLATQKGGRGTRKRRSVKKRSRSVKK